MSKAADHWPPVPVLGKHLYFMQTAGGEFVKIGITSDLVRRLAEVQRACPLLISSYTAIEGVSEQLEWAVHEYCISGWLRGEWFSTNQVVLRLLANAHDFDRLVSIVPEPIYPLGKIDNGQGGLLSIDEARMLLRDRARGAR